MLSEVPAPPWSESTITFPVSRPSAISRQAPSIASALAASAQAPIARLVRAHASLTAPNARTSSGCTGRPAMGKLAAPRAVWSPQGASAGRAISPSASRSIRVSAPPPPAAVSGPDPPPLASSRFTLLASPLSLTVHVPRAVLHHPDHLLRLRSQAGVEPGERLRDRGLPGQPGGRRAVVLQVLLEGGEGVGAAVFLDLARLREVHEVAPGAPEAVAGGAERRHVAERRDVADHLVEGAVVAEAELRRVDLLVLRVPAGVRAAAGGDLRHPESERLAADLGRLPGRHDDPGVGHGQAEDRHDLAEVDVGDGVRRVARDVGPGRWFHARHRDRVRPDAEPALEVADVLHERERLEAPVEQAEEDADADVVDPGFHRAVGGVDAPVEIALPARDVNPRVRVAVVGLLENLVGADLPRLQELELLGGERRDVDVDPPDLARAGGCLLYTSDAADEE